jgi:flagellar hook assembly protein FlgD
VTLQVFDVAGKVVRTLAAGEVLPAGGHEVVWQGRNDQGRSVASGVYLCRLKAGGTETARSLTLVK